MAISIIDHKSFSSTIKNDLVIQAIEHNRDRIRTISGMLLSLCGILISASIAIALFAVRDLKSSILATFFVIGVIFFFIGASFAIFSSLLRTKYTISTEAEFITDILELFYSELRLLRLALGTIASGMFIITLGTCVFLILTWKI